MRVRVVSPFLLPVDVVTMVDTHDRLSRMNLFIDAGIAAGFSCKDIIAVGKNGNAAVAKPLSNLVPVAVRTQPGWLYRSVAVPKPDSET